MTFSAIYLLCCLGLEALLLAEVVQGRGGAENRGLLAAIAGLIHLATGLHIRLQWQRRKALRTSPRTDSIFYFLSFVSSLGLAALLLTHGRKILGCIPLIWGLLVLAGALVALDCGRQYATRLGHTRHRITLAGWCGRGLALASLLAALLSLHQWVLPPLAQTICAVIPHPASPPAEYRDLQRPSLDLLPAQQQPGTRPPAADLAPAPTAPDALPAEPPAHPAPTPAEEPRASVQWPWTVYALAALIILCVLALLWWVCRTRPRAAVSKPPQEDDSLPHFYTAFVAAAAAAGCPRPAGATPREFCRLLSGRGLIGQEFRAMVHYLYRTRYESAPCNSEDENFFLNQIQAAAARWQQERTTAGLPAI